MADRKRKFNLNNPKDIDEILKLLWDDEDDQGQEEFGDESDTDAEDNVETRQENSETEQSDTSDEENEIESTNFQENQTYYMGRDKETKWFSSAFPEGRCQAHYITKRLPGVIGEAKTARTPLECWSQLVSDEILEIIVQSTNQYIDSIKSSFSRARDATPTDLIELKAFIGLLFLIGI
ncbi:hypothetical protein HHI36_013575 [Cryptolaemus montrouzieri]|uniref:PiggyBac transposable element-derived protein domain-containing protein n=1 Tax=Cryptolaemus montrouzieri TaxID=559131 RepID=A0ABD2NII2_9CUCU